MNDVLVIRHQVPAVEVDAAWHLCSVETAAVEGTDALAEMILDQTILFDDTLDSAPAMTAGVISDGTSGACALSALNADELHLLSAIAVRDAGLEEELELAFGVTEAELRWLEAVEQSDFIVPAPDEPTRILILGRDTRSTLYGVIDLERDVAHEPVASPPGGVKWVWSRPARVRNRPDVPVRFVSTDGFKETCYPREQAPTTPMVAASLGYVE